VPLFLNNEFQYHFRILMNKSQAEDDSRAPATPTGRAWTAFDHVLPGRGSDGPGYFTSNGSDTVSPLRVPRIGRKTSTSNGWAMVLPARSSSAVSATR
jgi:hypothetical protein